MLREELASHRILLAIVPLIALMGCVVNPNTESRKSHTVDTYGDWIGIVDNGDKPGIGILLSITTRGKVFELYLLDPEYLDDFSRGRKIQAANLAWEGEAVRFDLDFGGGYQGSYNFAFKKTEGAPTLSAILQELRDDRGPVQMILRKNE